MTDIRFTSDGNGTLYCSRCGISGAPVQDAIIHADWHDQYDAMIWRQGWLARGAELAALVAGDEGKQYTPAERAGVRKAYQKQIAAMEGGAQ